MVSDPQTRTGSARPLQREVERRGQPAAVAAAAEQLVAVGEEPRIITVQARIGGGSFSTVKRYLDDWKAAQATAPTLVEVPPTVQEQAVAFGRTVWQAALVLTEQQIAQVRAEAAHQVAQARAAEGEAVQEVTHLETQLEALAQQLVTAQQERDAAHGEVDALVLAKQLVQARLEEQRSYMAALQNQLAVRLLH